MPQTEGERLVALETWKESHEKGHGNSYKERLKKVESRVDALFLGVLAAIAGMAGVIVTLVSQ